MSELEKAKKDLAVSLSKNAELQTAYDAAVKTRDTYKVKLDKVTEEKTKADDAIVSLKAELKTAKEANSTEELEALKAKNAELEALKAKNPAAKLVTEGTFAKGKKVFKFKDGFVKTRTRDGELISSADALKDADLMNHLIGVGYAGLELVK